MFKKLLDTVNSRKYQLFHNGEKTKFESIRIKGFKEYIKYLAKNPELKEYKAFFIYNEPNFASFGMSETLDLIWTDWDGRIIHIEESFDMNKISPSIKDNKYIYILPKNSVKKNKILTNDTLTHVFLRGKSEVKLGDFI